MGSSNISIEGSSSTSNDLMMESISLTSDVSAFQYDGLSLPVFAVDFKGDVVLWNRRLAEVTGITPLSIWNGSQTVVPVTTLLSDCSKQQWDKALQTALANGNAKCFIEIKCQGGMKGFSVNLASQASSPAGDVTAVVCFAEEKVAPQQRHNSVAPSPDICLQSIEMPIIGVDLEQKICLWNKSIAGLSGLDASKAMGCQVQQFVSVSCRQAIHEAIAEAIKGQSSPTLELEIPYDTGEKRCLFASVVPWHPLPHEQNNSDSIVGALVVGHDVTEVAAHNRAAAESAIELRQLLDTANAPLFGVDGTGRINEWNQFMTEITGFSADEAFHENFIDAFIHPNRQNVTESILECALKGRGTTNVDMEVRTKLGEVRSLLLSASTRRNIRNEIVGAIFFAVGRSS